jgi:flagellin
MSSPTFSVSAGSLRAQNNLGKVSSELGKVYERLSSGQRINRASDDPAGLALADKLSNDSRLASVAIRNANDGVSLTNIVDDSLSEISSVLQRMAELAEQSSNGIYTNTQRSALSLEFEALGSEINRIAVVTKFNDISLLSNSSNITFQVGLDGTTNSQITLSAITGTLSSMNLASSGGDALTFSLLGTTTSAAQSASQLALTAVNAAIGSISSRRGTIGAGQSRLESAINTLSSQRENFLAAESQVRDADVAQEVAEMVRLQVLQQASTAVLAQANQQPQVAFALLS